MAEPLRMAELCAGYGGLHLSMLAAGWRVELAWYAENDDDACKVLDAHHPGVPNVGDITTAQFSACEPVDVLAAGFPCTPISGAGKQLGSADERWLWDDVARAVRVLQPAVFLGENVPRLLTIEDGALFGGILADLDGLGYTVRWTMVGACKVGLCHHRHRIFIAADRVPVELERYPLARRRDGGWETAADTLFGAGALPEWPAAGVASGGLVWELPAEPCGVTSGVALLPTPTTRDGMSGPGQSESAEGGPDLRTVLALLPTPRARDHKGRDPNPRGSSGDLGLPAAVQPGRFGPYEAAVRRHELVTGRPAPEPREPAPKGGYRLAPRFVEFMQALPAGWVTDHLGRNPALARLGNGIAIPAGAYALSILLPDGIRPELAEVTHGALPDEGAAGGRPAPGEGTQPRDGAARPRIP